ncbi:MAG: SDR family oxidoreductase [Myxococcota bacterium]
MDNKVIIVTGGNRGLGEETARQLVERGHHVIITARSVPQGEEAARKIRARHTQGRVDVMALDLASLASVRAFAAAFKDRKQPLRALINNAGVFTFGKAPRKTTVDGFELHFGTNHLGHFLLTHLLLEDLVASAPSRVVTLSSGLHLGGMGSPPGHIDFNDLNQERDFSPGKAYANSKLANLLFAFELHRRMKGRGITSNAVSPRVVPETVAEMATGFTRLMMKHVMPLMPFSRTKEQAVANTVFAAVDPSVEGVGGQYLEDCQPARSSPESHDEAVAARLWMESLKLCGIEKDLSAAA